MKRRLKVFFVIVILCSVVGCTVKEDKEPEKPKIKTKIKTEIKTETKIKYKKLTIAVVDQDKIWTESEQAQKYQDQLNVGVEAIREEYNLESEGLNEEEKMKKHEEVYQRINDLRERLKEEFKVKIKKAVEKIAKEDEIDVILDKQDVEYGGIDITTKVLESLE